MSNEVNVDAESIKKSAEDLVELIKLRTFPFGMKLIYWIGSVGTSAVLGRFVFLYKS